MEILDLNRLNGIKVDQIINSKMGGRFGLREKVNIVRGVGGLLFQDDQSETRDRYKSNLEVFKLGIGIYCRNIIKNYLIIIPFDQLKEISIVKPADMLVLNGISFFSIARRLGLNYWQSKVFLLESEIIEDNKLKINFVSDKQTLTLELKRINAMPVIRFFEQPFLKPYVKIDVFE